MLKSYFTLAIRNFWKQKIFSLINVSGLAIGISAALVIYLLVQYDFSFDKFHKGGKSIYRVVSSTIMPDLSEGIYYRSDVPSPMGNAVRNETTGLDEVSLFTIWDDKTKVSVPLQSAIGVFKKQKNIVYADEHYFNLFNYKWLAGSPKISLQQPNQVVLSESYANLYFPGLAPDETIGKEIIFNDTIHTFVSGVVEDFKQNSDFTFKAFVSNTSLEIKNSTGSNNDLLSQLFIKLSPGSTTAQIQTQVSTLFKRYYPDLGNKVISKYELQPLNNIHFNNNFSAFDNRLAHRPTLYGLLAVAVFLLLLACINFINLSTAQASQRAKEIGIRKTMGSSKKQLIVQFLGETFLLTLIATIVSVTITPLLLKVFSDFIPEGLQFNFKNQPGIILFLFVLTVVVSIIAGFYPALVLSGYRPVTVLKNQSFGSIGKSRNLWLRKTLTISQFVIAQVFIIATILVSRQIRYTLNKDMGFKKEAIIYFETNADDTVRNRVMVLRDKLKAVPGIEIISLSDDPIITTAATSLIMHYQDDKKKLATIVQVKMGDSNYIKLYGLKLLAGNYLQQSDTIKEYIINETYAHILGFQDPQQAIGKYIEGAPIAGVVSDFHQQSLHQKIQPIAIGCISQEEYVFNIALQRQDAQGAVWKTAINQIKKAFKEVYPEDDFQYAFIDESIAKYYRSEQNISRLLIWSTGMSVFISCFGLLGLVIFISNQRTKEIGVRKILGASVSQIVSLLSKDFLKLIVIAFIISLPPAWYAANKWLANFAYRIDLSLWIFIAGGLIMLSFAFLVLGIKTFRAASANPVKSLRTE
jgi:putative ABC transport system permease protein